MMNISAIVDQDTSMGLRLSGIKEIYIPDDQNTHIKIWNHLIEKEDIGMILISEDIVEKLGKSLKEFRLRNTIPIVVEIPDKNGRKKEHIDFVSHLIKKAVGIEVNKNKI